MGLALPIGAVCLSVLGGSPACDQSGACSGVCPTGLRVTVDSGCECLPFDAGYCRVLAECPDAVCPASATPDACGGGALWSTTICGCYALPEAGLPKH
jgi:hypothetical protein